MILQIELDPKQEKMLHREAMRLGVSAQIYAANVLEATLTHRPDGEVVLADFDDILDELAAIGRTISVQNSPLDWSRDTIYLEHD